VHDLAASATILFLLSLGLGGLERCADSVLMKERAGTLSIEIDGKGYG